MYGNQALFGVPLCYLGLTNSVDHMPDNSCICCLLLPDIRVFLTNICPLPMSKTKTSPSKKLGQAHFTLNLLVPETGVEPV